MCLSLIKLLAVISEAWLGESYHFLWNFGHCPCPRLLQITYLVSIFFNVTNTGPSEVILILGKGLKSLIHQTDPIPYTQIDTSLHCFEQNGEQNFKTVLCCMLMIPTCDKCWENSCS